jgi:DNA-directed RNA polymerase subunit RPC12/RpoP
MAQFIAIPTNSMIHPVCSACGARMSLNRTQPEYLGRERHIYRCTRCKYEMSEVVDPKEAA